MTESEDKQYAQDMLALNPAHDSDRVLRRRNEYLGLASSNAEPELDSFQRRRLAEQQIDQMRALFWETSSADTLQKLDDLSLAELPDLQLAVDRLRVVSELRAQFDQLARHPNSRPMMLSALKRIVVLPPRHAGPFRDQILRSLTASDHLRAYKSMAQTIRNDFPQIYELESDWLTNVERRRKRASNYGMEIVVIGLALAFIAILWILGLFL